MGGGSPGRVRSERARGRGSLAARRSHRVPALSGSEEDMQLDLSEDQELLRDAFAQLLAVESSAERVRAAEATGFDPALWAHLTEVAAFGVRVPEARGGLGGSLLDAVLLAEQAGRHLATGPLVETVAVCSELSHLEDPRAVALVDALVAGERIASFAPRETEGERVLVAGGAVATAVVGLDAGELVVIRARGAARARPRHRCGGLRLVVALRDGRRGDARRARARSRRSRGLGADARRVAARHGGGARGARAPGDRDRRRLRDGADPVRSPDRLVPGGGPSPGPRWSARSTGARCSCVGRSSRSPRASPRPRRSSPTPSRGSPSTRRARPTVRSTPTAATASPTSTTSSSITAARSPGRSPPVIRPTPTSTPRTAATAGGSSRCRTPGTSRSTSGSARDPSASARRCAASWTPNPISEELAANQHNFDGHDPEFHRALRRREAALSRLARGLRWARARAARGRRDVRGDVARAAHDPRAQRDVDGRADADRARLGGPEAGGAPADPARRGDLQPRLHGAGLGLGRRRRRDRGPARRRRLADRRPEDVHQRREHRAVRVPADPHESRRGEAQGAHDVPRASRPAGHRDPADPHALRRADERDLLHRRACARPLPDRPGRRWLDRSGPRAASRARLERRRRQHDGAARHGRRRGRLGATQSAGRGARDRRSAGCARRSDERRRRPRWRRSSRGG